MGNWYSVGLRYMAILAEDALCRGHHSSKARVTRKPLNLRYSSTMFTAAQIICQIFRTTPEFGITLRFYSQRWKCAYLERKVTLHLITGWSPASTMDFVREVYLLQIMYKKYPWGLTTLSIVVIYAAFNSTTNFMDLRVNMILAYIWIDSANFS